MRKLARSPLTILFTITAVATLALAQGVGSQSELGGCRIDIRPKPKDQLSIIHETPAYAPGAATFVTTATMNLVTGGNPKIFVSNFTGDTTNEIESFKAKRTDIKFTYTINGGSMELEVDYDPGTAGDKHTWSTEYVSGSFDPLAEPVEPVEVPVRADPHKIRRRIEFETYGLRYGFTLSTD